MPSPSVVRSAKLELRAHLDWNVDECRIVALFAEPTRLYAWVRRGPAAEIRGYEEASGTLREVFRLVAPNGIAAIARDGGSICVVGDADACGDRSVRIVRSGSSVESPEFGLELRKSFCGASWEGDETAVALAISGSWPVGALWRPHHSRSWINLEPHPALDFSFHQPVVAMSSDHELVAISRRYAGLEVFHPQLEAGTCTPTAIEFESSARRGWLWTSALALSDDGTRVMMSSADANRSLVLVGLVDTAMVKQPLEKAAFWLDRETGPRTDDPLLPDDGLLRVFPSAPKHISARSCELQLDRAFVTSDVNAHAQVYAIATLENVMAGSLSEDGTSSLAEVRGGARSVRIGRDGVGVAAASSDGLRLFDLRRP
jgi:hypothetical protein